MTAKGTRVKTPVSKSNFIKYNIIKPTGNKSDPISGLPVATITEMAKNAANPKIAPAIKARTSVSLVDIKILDSPASTILVANSLGSIYDIKVTLKSLIDVMSYALSMPKY